MARRHTIDDILAIQLLSGATIRQAAGAVGVSERTARRRSKDPAFQLRLATFRRRLVRYAFQALRAKATSAAEKLGKLLEHPSPFIRLQTALALLKWTP